MLQRRYETRWPSRKVASSQNSPAARRSPPEPNPTRKPGQNHAHSRSPA